MRTSFFALVMIAGFGAMGCSGVEGDCETICNWIDDCGGDADSDCVDECVEDVDDADDECQTAFEEFAGCLEDDDSCDEGSDCVGEATNFAEDCEDDL